jgi:hypothetical protein
MERCCYLAEWARAELLGDFVRELVGLTTRCVDCRSQRQRTQRIATVKTKCA